MDPSRVTRRVGDVTRPPSVVGGMRKAGVLLIATPDPFTAVPGVALLASSAVAKRKEPASLETLAKETLKVIRDVESMRL